MGLPLSVLDIKLQFVVVLAESFPAHIATYQESVHFVFSQDLTTMASFTLFLISHHQYPCRKNKNLMDSCCFFGKISQKITSGGPPQSWRLIFCTINANPHTEITCKNSQLYQLWVAERHAECFLLKRTIAAPDQRLPVWVHAVVMTTLMPTTVTQC